MTDFFEKKFMDEMEKKSTQTALLLYGATTPIIRTSDEHEERLSKVFEVGLKIIDDTGRYFYKVTSRVGEKRTLDTQTEIGFYDTAVDKMCCMTEIFTQCDLNYIRSTFAASMAKGDFCLYDTTGDIRLSMKWSLKQLFYILLGIFEESR